jgi:hypothetical protein
MLAFTLSLAAEEFGNNELAFSLGVSAIPQRSTAAGLPVRFGESIAYEANFAHRFYGDSTQLFLEVPFVAEPSNGIRSSDSNTVISLASIFIVPSARVKFASKRVLSPWLSAGIGYGLREGSEFYRNGTQNASQYDSTGVLQFGGGADVGIPLKIWLPITLRGEVRDFYSFSNPNFGTPVNGSGQHNIVASGGFVLHF